MHRVLGARGRVSCRLSRKSAISSVCDRLVVVANVPVEATAGDQPLRGVVAVFVAGAAAAVVVVAAAVAAVAVAAAAVVSAAAAPVVAAPAVHAPAAAVVAVVVPAAAPEMRWGKRLVIRRRQRWCWTSDLP